MEKPKKYKVFTELEIDDKQRRGRYTKEDLANDIGLPWGYFDFALPQDWINAFVKDTGLNYDLVRSTCFTVYDGGLGRIVSGLKEIQDILDSEK